MTQSKALAMAYKLHPDCNWKLSDGTELVKNSAYYEFKLFELDWSDGGSDWFFAVNKETGLAYKHYSDNTLVRDSESTPSKQTITKPVKQAESYDKAYAAKFLVVKCLPGASFKTSGTIKIGTEVKVYGGVPIGEDQNNLCSADQYGWSKIKYNDTDAWVKTDELSFVNSYNWAPGIKEKFENEIIDHGYANKKSSIRYKREDSGPYIANGAGVYQVYTDVSGQNCVVNVDVKTGWFHG